MLITRTGGDIEPGNSRKFLGDVLEPFFWKGSNAPDYFGVVHPGHARHIHPGFPPQPTDGLGKEFDTWNGWVYN